MTPHVTRDDRPEFGREGSSAEPSPLPAPRSVFSGRGMFTVERPQDTAGLRLDWQLDQPPKQKPYAWGYGIHVCLQAEAHWSGPPDRERALVTNLDPAIFTEGWPDGWTCMPECYWNADVRDKGRSVPNMIYRAQQVIGDKWGTVPVVPIIGCYDASSENPGVGVRLTVPDYLPDLEWAMRTYPCVVGWGMWRVETLDDADREALK